MFVSEKEGNPTVANDWQKDGTGLAPATGSSQAVSWAAEGTGTLSATIDGVAVFKYVTVEHIQIQFLVQPSELGASTNFGTLPDGPISPWRKLEGNPRVYQSAGGPVLVGVLVRSLPSESPIAAASVAWTHIDPPVQLLPNAPTLNGDGGAGDNQATASVGYGNDHAASHTNSTSSEGLAQVAFTPSRFPGDNHVFCVEVTLPDSSTVSGTSTCITAWHRHTIEVDGMVQASGSAAYYSPVTQSVSTRYAEVFQEVQLLATTPSTYEETVWAPQYAYPWDVTVAEYGNANKYSASASLHLVGVRFLDSRTLGELDGYTEAIHATVNMGKTRTAPQSARWSAHELGHTLLGAGHPSTGIMSYQQGDINSLHFIATDATVFRSAP